MKLKNIVRLPDDQRARLQAIIEREGVYGAASLLGVSRHAMERAAQGSTIHKGTALLLRPQLVPQQEEQRS